MSKHKTLYSYTHSFLGTTKHLVKIRRLGYKQFLYFLLYVNSLKKFLWAKQKFNCFKKMSSFSYSLFPKILKLRRSSLRLVFLIKIYVTSFYFLRIIDYGIEWGVSYDLFPLIWNPLYLIGPQSYKFPIEWSQLKFYKVWNKNGSVKRKTSNNRTRVFEIALEGGNGKVEGIEILLGRASIIQCFCHANIFKIPIVTNITFFWQTCFININSFWNINSIVL